MFQDLTRRDFIKTTSLAALGFFISGCCGGDNKSASSGSDKPVDLVVHGKIFTSEDNKIVEAFAVKDGKFVYFGDKAGVEAFIENGKTEVIDYSGKGLVMPSCSNAHAHYSIGHGIPKAGTMIDRDDSVEKFLTEIIPAAVKKARDKNSTAVFGFGWDFMKFKDNLPTRQQLDAICDDIPMYFADEEGHKGLANTLALVNSGIMSKEGAVLKKGKDIRGGEIIIGEDGTPTGYLIERAGVYTNSFLDNKNLYYVDIAKTTMPEIEQHLLSEGYTMYLDGYANYFFNNNFYEAAQEMYKAGDMHFVLGLAYEIESWMNVDDDLAKAVDAKRYTSAHVKPNWIKLFMDGTG